MGYEVREYLLEKWNRECAYCGGKNVPLEIEHIQPLSKGGSDRISNLTLACRCYNQKKGNKSLSEFLDNKNKLEKIQAQAKAPLKDAAAVNSTRFAIVKMAKELCQSVKCWTGGRTKFNRINQGFGKSHSVDASCIGESGSKINLLVSQPLIVESKGHGTRQAVRCNRYGFPSLGKNGQPIKPKSRYTHAASGDIVKFFLDKDRKNTIAGIYTARVKTPTPKGFEVKIKGVRVSQNRKFLIRFVHRNDGYAYSF